MTMVWILWFEPLENSTGLDELDRMLRPVRGGVEKGRINRRGRDFIAVRVFERGDATEISRLVTECGYAYVEDAIEEELHYEQMAERGGQARRRKGRESLRAIAADGLLQTASCRLRYWILWAAQCCLVPRATVLEAMPIEGRQVVDRATNGVVAEKEHQPTQSCGDDSQRPGIPADEIPP
jgi:hypothetical protein